MPRYYCDYCDTYLTHDSPSVRKQHNAGYKHKANVRSYYQQFEEQQTQSLIDQRIKEHLGQAAAFHQVGATFNQHLMSLQGNPQRPRLPILPPPMLPMGASPQGPIPSLFQGMRPPVLPLPMVGAPGYFLNPKYQYSNDVINDDEVLNSFHRVVNRMVNDNTTRLNINKEAEKFRLRSGVFSSNQFQSAVNRCLPGYGAPPTAPPSMPMQMNTMPRPPMMNLPATGMANTSTSNGAATLANPATYGAPAAPTAATVSQEGFTYSQTSEINH